MSAQTTPTTTSTGTEAKRDLRREVVVREVFHGTDVVFGSAERKSGPAPEHADYQSFVSFGDPDGSGWLLQEVRTRLPGRVTGANFGTELPA